MEARELFTAGLRRVGTTELGRAFAGSFASALKERVVQQFARILETTVNTLRAARFYGFLTYGTIDGGRCQDEDTTNFDASRHSSPDANADAPLRLPLGDARYAANADADADADADGSSDALLYDGQHATATPYCPLHDATDGRTEAVVVQFS